MKRILLFLILCITLVACDTGEPQNQVPAPDGSLDQIPTEEVKEETITEGTKDPTPTQPEHTHQYIEEWKFDDDGHWYECSCKEKDKKVPHVINERLINATCDVDGKKIFECECGYSYFEVIPAEGHNYSNEWTSDEVNHWHECICGDKVDLNAHDFKQTGIKVEQTEEVAGIIIETCEDCGKTREKNIGTLGHTHVYEEKWTSDEIYHWHKCSCDEVSEKGIHKGGEATETSQAICEVCNTPYGQLKEAEKLGTPILFLDEETGVVTWEAVEGATHYNYIINGGEVQTTLELSIILVNETNVSVQAANSEAVSSYSKAMTYYDLSDVIIETEKDVYVYFHNTSLLPVLVKTGNKVERPANPTKVNYVFDDFYEDPFYQTKFDFNKPIETSTIIYANWLPNDLIKDAYFWVKGDPKMTSNIMSSGTKSDWHFIPLKVNEGQTKYKEFYVTISVTGATSTNPCQFIIMDGFDDEPGRTYWKKADGTDFTIKSDGIYDIYFSVEHEYDEKVHIYVGAVTNTSASMINGILGIGLETPVVNIDNENNKASWNLVSNATKYEVVINNEEPIIITTNSIDLPVKSHISVRALSEVSSSKWSIPKANLNYVPKDNESEYIYVYFKGLESIKINKNNPLTEPKTPTLEEHYFDGWYYDISLTKRVVFPVTLTENTVFYPKWILEGNYSTDVYYNLVNSDGTVVKGFVWNLDNYNYDEYKSGIVSLKANTNYYIESVDKSQKWGPYKVDVTGEYKIYFSPDYLWDVGTENERNAYFARQSKEITVYFSNNKGWSGDIKAYIWNSLTDEHKQSWPGANMEFVKTNDYGEKIYKVTVDLALYDSIIFTNGSNQTVDILLSSVESGTGYYISDGQNVGKYKYE